MRPLRLLILVCATIAVSLVVKAQQVIRYSGADSSLDGRWKWALHETRESSDSKGYWVGYSIKRLMDEDSYVLSGNVFSGNVRTRISLYDIISGEKSIDTRKNGGAWNGERAKIFKVEKDIAILFRFSRSASGDISVEKIEIANMELSVDLKNRPLFWLGRADDEQSVARLKEIFGEVSTDIQKKAVLEAIGVHQRSDNAYPFLTKILSSGEHDEVRSQAAFWMGEQNCPEGLQTLIQVAQNDRSQKVREQAVFAISVMDMDESTEALITLAQKAKDSHTRAKAAFWLGNKASQKVIATLENIVADDEETDVQRQALYALSRTQDKDGVDRLIRISKTHPNPRIRKQAVQLLGQSDDPKALEALIEIVRK
jgi:HEAT repeat protein